MDNTDYVSYKTAVKLKECGFDLECHHYYHGNKICEGCGNNNYNDIRGYPNWLSAPCLWEAQKWLRNEKKCHIEVRINGVRSMFSVEIWEMKSNGYTFHLEHKDGHARLFEDYEAALSAGISAALELIGKEDGR